MADWKEYNLKEVISLRKELFQPQEAENVPYVGLEHIEPHSFRLSGIGKSEEVSSQKYKFYPDDILYGKLRPYFRKICNPNFNGICSTDIFVFKVREDFDSKFIFYLLADEKFTELANGGSTGTRMPRADWGHLKETIWNLPSLPTQRRIAAILSSLDDKIELNNAINKNLEELAQTLFKRWFVDFEFPMTEDYAASIGKPELAGQPYKSSGGEMVESEMGMIPKGWEVGSLTTIADYLNGLALQKYPAADEHISLPVIKIRELRQGVSENTDRASWDIPPEYIIQDGDILFSWSGTLMIDYWCNGTGALNQHLFKVSSSKFPKWFIYLWTAHYLPRFIEIAASKATTMGHIQRGHLTDAAVLIPDTLTLVWMTQSMEKLESALINNNLESRNLQKTRDKLLPKLISGQLELQND